MAPPLAELDVVFVDCQATMAAPRGHLLELAWARGEGEVASRLTRLPAGASVPPAVARLTGITSALTATGVEPREAWRALEQELGAGPRPVPAVAHFARFERPFLEALGGAGVLELACTHELALRLFPELPRRSLRALTGYFGRGVSPLRRAGEHVEATRFLWRELVKLLGARGVGSWEALRGWLAQPEAKKRRARFGWPMPREVRLALPDAPGLYRMLRTQGDVLYVGKAASLKKRVNSYFRKQHGVHERTLEMLSQARGLSFVVTDSPLEAALLEPDEIKRHRPPYNVAQADDGRQVWFAAPDWSARAPQRSAATPLGPFPQGELVDQVAALARGEPAALGRWGPPPDVFAEGYARLCRAHGELSRASLSPVSRLLHLGGRLWREGRREREEAEDAPAPEAPPEPRWTAELAFQELEWLTVRAALALRRARWLTRLCEASLVWSEAGAHGTRALVFEAGALGERRGCADAEEPPVPPGHMRTALERHAGFDAARLDRLRVLSTELKRLVAAGAPVALRLGEGAPLREGRLARALEWV